MRERIAHYLLVVLAIFMMSLSTSAELVAQSQEPHIAITKYRPDCGNVDLRVYCLDTCGKWKWQRRVSGEWQDIKGMTEFGYHKNLYDQPRGHWYRVISKKTGSNDEPCMEIKIYVPAGPALYLKGYCDGSATASAGNGQPPYTFAWSDGSTGEDVSGLASGKYWVTVTDALGCTTTRFVEIGNAPTFVAESSNATCGSSNGTATVNALSGDAPFRYKWSNGATTQTITGLSAGSYSVTVTDAHHCSATKSVGVENVGQTKNTKLDFTGCGSVTLPDGSVITETSFWEVVYLTEAGCDSVVTYSVTITEPEELTVFGSAEYRCGEAENNYFERDSIVTDGCQVIEYWHEVIVTPYEEVSVVFDTINICGEINEIILRCDSTITDGCTKTKYITPVKVVASEWVFEEYTTCAFPITINGTEIKDQGSYLFEEGCVTTMYTVFLSDSKTTVLPTMLTCNPANVGLDTTYLSTVLGCDSIVVQPYSLAEKVTTVLPISYVCDSDSVRIDTTILTSAFGCDSLVVQSYSLAENVQEIKEMRVCSSDFPVILHALDDSLLINEAGLYTFVQGCKEVLYDVSLAPEPVVVLNAQQPDCEDQIGKVWTEFRTKDTDLFYDGISFVPTNRGDTIIVNPGGGLCIATVVDTLGCESSDSIYVNAVPETISVEIETVWDCPDTLGRISTVVTGGSGDFDYSWNGSWGEFSEDEIRLARSGFYAVTVTDIESGCMSTASVVLETPTCVLPGNEEVCDVVITHPGMGEILKVNIRHIPGESITNIRARVYEIATGQFKFSPVLALGQNDVYVSNLSAGAYVLEMTAKIDGKNVTLWNADGPVLHKFTKI